MSKVYANGTATVTLAANDKISTYSDAPINIYRQVGYPNQPSSWTLVTALGAGVSYISSAFASGATLRVDAGAADVSYSVGAAPVSPFGVITKAMRAPATATTAATLTAAQMATGLISATPTATGATVAYTLPTGTLMEAIGSFSVDDSFEWSIHNLAAAAADTITVTAGTAHTVLGSMLVASNHATTSAYSAARFRTRKTAANTWVTYRVG